MRDAASTPRGLRGLTWLPMPLALVVAVVGWLVLTDPIRDSGNGAAGREPVLRAGRARRSGHRPSGSRRRLGASFDHEIAVAVPAPKATSGQLRAQALIGSLIGIVPVAIGAMFHPVPRNVRQGGMNFFLALTVGLLAFLLIDGSAEALELATKTAAIFQRPVMVVLAAW
ncbi:hypothetical protein [Defluviimonas salinarum]|uniref:Uncharacterized protein n=1 Tax=Defluviimonas salinarum TaxID=2992147 RepID=A0ABT3J9R0_9RHOB|nr:hypothetical protein [Defluviimonas salinarum]MCW3784410.1 hypothetical protein [Defluviimonas salinarum]